MSGVRNNADIVKGSKLMVFIDDEPVGFATSHTLNLTTNTSEVTTKDSGDYQSQIVQSISWEVTAENFYSNAGQSIYFDKMTTKQPVSIVFAPVSTWYEQGVLQDNGSSTDWAAGTPIASGQALITSISVNAPAGDNATLSVTFTGVGPFNTGQ